MARIDLPKVLSDSLTAAKAEIGKGWNNVKPFAEHSFQQLAEDAQFLTRLRVANQIDDDELLARFNMQALAAKNVLLAVKGIGLVTAQNAINAVIGIISKALGEAFNIPLPF